MIFARERKFTYIGQIIRKLNWPLPYPLVGQGTQQGQLTAVGAGKFGSVGVPTRWTD